MMNGFNDVLIHYLSTSFNNNFYIKFFNSKRNKDIHDYKDMLKRFARATGIIEINNGIVNLAYRDVWVEYLKYIDFNKLIFNINEERETNIKNKPAGCPHIFKNDSKKR